MLKSICIKTNNKDFINYLLNELEIHEFEKYNLEKNNLEKFNDLKFDDLKNIFISKLKFSKYTNIIIHYKGKNVKKFLYFVSDIISSGIIKYYEQKILKHLLICNYFYFTEIEQSKILDICKNNLDELCVQDFSARKKIISNSIIQYFSTNNKHLILTGFINFRLCEYFKILDTVLEASVNKFVVDREYLEFINLLKTYVSSKNSGLNLVHLIYTKQESILLDEFKDIINLDNNILDAKFISDISFSSNDYTLNSLLTILPKKIYIHLVNSYEDEFINTLKLIFDNRIYICKDCDICRLYSLNANPMRT